LKKKRDADKSRKPKTLLSLEKYPFLTKNIIRSRKFSTNIRKAHKCFKFSHRINIKFRQYNMFYLSVDCSIYPKKFL